MSFISSLGSYPRLAHQESRGIVLNSCRTSSWDVKSIEYSRRVFGVARWLLMCGNRFCAHRYLSHRWYRRHMLSRRRHCLLALWLMKLRVTFCIAGPTLLSGIGCGTIGCLYDCGICMSDAWQVSDVWKTCCLMILIECVYIQRESFLNDCKVPRHAKICTMYIYIHVWEKRGETVWRRHTGVMVGENPRGWVSGWVLRLLIRSNTH